MEILWFHLGTWRGVWILESIVSLALGRGLSGRAAGSTPPQLSLRIAISIVLLWNTEGDSMDAPNGFLYGSKPLSSYGFLCGFPYSLHYGVAKGKSIAYLCMVTSRRVPSVLAMVFHIPTQLVHYGLFYGFILHCSTVFYGDSIAYTAVLRTRKA